MIVSGSTMDIPSQSLFDMLTYSVQTNPQGRATVFYGNELSYEQLYRAVLGFMGQLQSAGIQMGDRVGIMLPNSPNYLIAYYAITGMGAVVVQVNPMSAGPELAFVLNDSGASVLVAFDKFLPLIESVRQETPALAKVIAVRLGASDAVLAESDVWFDEWLSSASQLGSPASFDPLHTLAVLQYTGGTTGRPKGAMLSHGNLVANAYQAQAMLPGGSHEDDMMVCALPFFHVYAMTICMNYAVLNQLSMLIVPRFDAAEMVQLIRQYQPTLFPAVPTMYVALTQAVPEGSTDLHCLRICNSGGAPLPLQVMTDFERASGAIVLEGYGLTEASPVTHTNPSKELRRVGSIGLPTPNTDVKIVNVEDHSEMLVPGEEGELAVRGPQVMMGYWKRPEDTAKTLVEDGWLLTGDIAKMDADGYAYIVDRKKDMIIASGYNIYPREVEEVLYQHPGILEAAVIGVPDEYRGETVKAFVVIRPGHELSAADVERWCRDRMAPYKIPKQIEFMDALPKTAVGKILRRALRT